MRRTLIALTIAGVLAVTASTARASIIGPIYPAPGGTTFTTDGGSLIGQNPSPYRTRIYSGFDSTQWDTLYFNLTDGTIGNVFFTTDTTPYTLSGNTIEWLPTTQWTFNTAFGPVSTSVKLVTSFYQADGTTPLSVSDFTLAPMAGMPGLVLDISAADLLSWGGGFQVRQVYQTLAGVDASDFYNGFSTFGGFSSATNAAFYYTPVPEPATLVLSGFGIAATVYRRRRAERRQGADGLASGAV